eukprot:COSAG06_NODE_1121_length_10629_cov_348.665337_3_plen_69_part_00
MYNQQDLYIFSGKEAPDDSYAPTFVYHGFRCETTNCCVLLSKFPLCVRASRACLGRSLCVSCESLNSR